jgi:hypothetical protein
MQMDVRAPMGAMFTVLGIALTGFGVFYARESLSLGINVNLWWGLIILGFGVVMLLLAWNAGRSAAGRTDVKAPPRDTPK